MGPRKSCSRAAGAQTPVAWFNCRGYRRTSSLVKLCPDQSRPPLVVQHRILIATHGSCLTMTPRSPTLPGTSIDLTEALSCHGYCRQSFWQCSKENWIQFRGGRSSQDTWGVHFPSSLTNPPGLRAPMKEWIVERLVKALRSVLFPSSLTLRPR